MLRFVCVYAGRQGTDVERRLLAYAMREGKAKLRLAHIEGNQARGVIAALSRDGRGERRRIVKLLPKHWRSRKFSARTSVAVVAIQQKQPGTHTYSLGINLGFKVSVDFEFSKSSKSEKQTLVR